MTVKPSGICLHGLPTSHLMAHCPKLSGCEVCDAKMPQPPARRRKKGDPFFDSPERFGDLLCADHLVVSKDDVSVDGSRAALLMQDRAAHFLGLGLRPKKGWRFCAQHLRFFR